MRFDGFPVWLRSSVRRSGAASTELGLSPALGAYNAWRLVRRLGRLGRVEGFHLDRVPSPVASSLRSRAVPSRAATPWAIRVGAAHTHTPILPSPSPVEHARELPLAIALGYLISSLFMDHAQSLPVARLTGAPFAGLPARERDL